MKNVFLIMMVLVIGFVSKAQTPFSTPNLLTGGATKITQNKGAAQFDSGLLVKPRFTDTASANLSVVSLYGGMLIRVLDTLWMRNESATRWNKMGGSVGSAGSYVDGIYRTPGIDSIYFTISGTTYAIKDSTDEDACDVIVDVLADIPELEDYSGNALTVIVTDSLRGGVFNYYTTGLTADNGIVFSATGKGGGVWLRETTQEPAILTDWFDIKPDGTDQTSKVVAAINAAQSGRIKTVKFGIGTFEFDTVRITTPGIVITGHGDSTILKKLTGSTGGSGLIQIAANYCRVENITLRDNGIETKLLNANHALAGVANFQMIGFKATGVKAYATNAGTTGIFVGRYQDAIISDCYAINTATTTADSLSFGIAFHSSSSVGEATNIIIKNNTIVGFFNGINSYGTGRRFETLIEGNMVTGAQRFGINGYHSTRSRIVNNRCDRNQVGIWSDSGSEPEAADSGYNRGYGNVVANNQCFRNSLYGFETEEFLGGTFTGNTADSNYIGFAFGGGTGGTAITGNIATRNLKYNFYFEKSVNPVENYIQDITFTGNVAKLAGEHGVKIGGIQRGLIISNNIITDNGALSKADTTLHYAGIWIGQDNGVDGLTPEQGTKTRGALITGNVIGDSIEIANGTGGNGYQYYGIFLQDTSITGRVYISGNQFESRKPYHIVANGNRITLSGNFFAGTAVCEYDTTKSNTALNYGYRDGEIDYGNDSSLTLAGAYTQTHLIMRGTHIWMDNDDRIRYNKNYPTNNRDGYLVLDNRDSSFWSRGDKNIYQKNVNDTVTMSKMVRLSNIAEAPTTDQVLTWSATNNLVRYKDKYAFIDTTATVATRSYVTQQKIGYTIQLPGGNASAPGDGLTFYFGDNPTTTLSQTAGLNTYYVPKSGTITKASVFVHVNGTLGSNETSSIYVRLNNTTDYLITSGLKTDATTQQYSNTSLNIPVTGDFATSLQIKWITPSWSSNPTNVRISVVLYVE